MSAVGEWLSCLWSWPQGLQANLPQGAKSLVTSLKSELVLEFFRSLPSSAWKLDLRGGSLASALDSPTPHFLSSECSPRWDHTGELIWIQEPEEPGRASACEDLPVVPTAPAPGSHVAFVMAPEERVHAFPFHFLLSFQPARGSDLLELINFLARFATQLKNGRGWDFVFLFYP